MRGIPVSGNHRPIGHQATIVFESQVADTEHMPSQMIIHFKHTGSARRLKSPAYGPVPLECGGKISYPFSQHSQYGACSAFERGCVTTLRRAAPVVMPSPLLLGVASLRPPATPHG